MRYIKSFIIFLIILVLGLLSNDTSIDSSKIIPPTNQLIIPVNQTEISLPSISVRPSVSYPGDTVLVESTKEGLIEFNGKSYRLSPSSTGYIAFLPISINQKPGELPIYYYPGDNASVMNDFMVPNIINTSITVKEKEFSTQYLEVTKQQQEMYYNTEKIAEDRTKVSAAMVKPIDIPQFSGEFLQPLEGRISTMYGYTRYVNGVLDSRHLAIDIAAPEGTPIIAPNDGNVVLADFLYLSGNRVIIDHGVNLFSSFSHMSKLNVIVGDQVKKGDVIGWVGSTGFSTGPHLHHAIYVHDEAVNPELFFGINPFNW